MKCFKHQNIDSVGQCKHCCKGLCTECAADTGNGLACKNEHEQQVEFINSLIENSKKAYSQSPKSSILSNLFLLLMGILFIGYSFINKNQKFLLLFGVLCVAYWGILFVYNSIYLKKLKTDYTK